jgi:hypothetical protein
MLKRLSFCLFLLVSANFALAGIPVDETVVCPVGGEEFTVTATLSCSTFGRTMSFRQETSCDFVTRLPLCPSNGLPVYQEYSDAQIAELTSLMETPRYTALRLLPPWQRAYGISVHLGQSETETSFRLLLSALWFETEPFFESLVALDQLIYEAEFELERAPEEARPFLNAILAYALAYAGRVEESDQRLMLARQAANNPDHLRQYIAAIEACQSNMEAAECRPDAPLDP